MKYFRLNEEIYFVPGKRPSLYNLFTGDVYLISEENANKLMEAENGNSISNYKDDKFFELLKDKGYGDFYSDKVFIEKINLTPDWYDYLYFKPAPMISRVTLKLANCQYKCDNCNVNKYKRYSPCLCNSKETNNKNTLTTEKIYKYLINLKKLDISELVVSGFSSSNLDKNAIIRNALELGFDSVRYIHCYNDIQKIDHIGLAKQGALVYLQVNQNEIDEEVLKEILDLNREKTTILLQVRFEEEDPLKYINFFNQNNISYIIDFVFNSRIKQNNISSLYNKEIPKVSADIFSLVRKRNKCLVGTFATLSNGDIVPCLGLKDFKVGTIDKLYDIFSEDKLLKYWDMSSREIAQCKDCGLRYACNDCRSLEIRLGAKIDEKISCMR